VGVLQHDGLSVDSHGADGAAKVRGERGTPDHQQQDDQRLGMAHGLPRKLYGDKSVASHVMKRAFVVIALFASPLFALEGKWTPQQVLQLDAAWLKKEGLELPPARLWDPKRGTGLLAATINVGGCSGGFISPEGLFITNHHCLFSILQEH